MLNFEKKHFYWNTMKKSLNNIFENSHDSLHFIDANIDYKAYMEFVKLVDINGTLDYSEYHMHKNGTDIMPNTYVHFIDYWSDHFQIWEQLHVIFFLFIFLNYQIIEKSTKSSIKTLLTIKFPKSVLNKLVRRYQ